MYLILLARHNQTVPDRNARILTDVGLWCSEFETADRKQRAMLPYRFVLGSLSAQLLISLLMGSAVGFAMARCRRMAAMGPIFAAPSTCAIARLAC
jgi:hypothetical protein